MPTLEIIGWVALAVVAGFFGYFGRLGAMWFIRKLRTKKPETGSQPSVPLDRGSKDSLKVEKKRAKQEAKQSKKAS